jgi:uncharacterized MAPEG superfamily protein
LITIVRPGVRPVNAARLTDSAKTAVIRRLTARMGGDAGEGAMSVELQLLVCAVALTVIQIVVAIVGTLSQAGLPWAAGNRDTPMEFTGWVGRAHRAHRNTLENLLLFAVLVLVAHVAGRENAMTALGAQIFLWSRAAYAVIYLLGLPYLRTAAWFAAVAGLALIFLQVI